MRRVAVRWTIGDVSPRGFRALSLSIRGALRLFGPDARYVVCVNGVTAAEARARTGPVPGEVEFRDTAAELPEFLSQRLDPAMAEGVAWKLAPLRVAPDRWEVALDNDCILWDLPEGLARWLADPRPDACALAQDVRRCFGFFDDLCGPVPLNTGIRATGPAFDLEAALVRILARRAGTLRSELDEQGLQSAALTRTAPTHVVSTRDVSICSPFPPHEPTLGRCGAHFVGLNAHTLGWSKDGRPAEAWTADHFDRHLLELRRRVRA